jgi:hypothetical protein
MAAIFIDHQPSDRIAIKETLIRDSYTDSAPISLDLPKYAVAVICSPTRPSPKPSRRSQSGRSAAASE